MALTREQRALADDNCADLIVIDQADGVLKLTVDGEEVAIRGGYVSPEVADDEVYVYVSAYYCAQRVEIVGNADGEPEPEPMP